MSAIKNYMFDVGEYAATNGIKAAMSKFIETEDNVKSCIIFSFAFDGDWEEFIAEGNWEPPAVH